MSIEYDETDQFNQSLNLRDDPPVDFGQELQPLTIAEKDALYQRALDALLKNKGIMVAPDSPQGLAVRNMVDEISSDLERMNCTIPPGIVRSDLIETIVECKLIQLMAVNAVVRIRKVTTPSPIKAKQLKSAIDFWNIAVNNKLRTYKMLGISGEVTEDRELQDYLENLKKKRKREITNDNST